MFASNTSAANGAANYIEDVFSTYLYTGNSSTQAINNGTDLAGKGGLVWLKQRNLSNTHFLFDTVRGVNNFLRSDTTNANLFSAGANTAFSSTGFSMNNAYAEMNSNGNTYASWTFRKQPKFFDVVTYTGNGSNQTISHSLGSAPGCILVKCTSNGTTNWFVYHSSLAVTSGRPGFMYLDSTSAVQTGDPTVWPSVPTSTTFEVGSYNALNGSGRTYVAYLFAHNAGGFGLTGTDNVISCGSYTGTSDYEGPVVNLGFEPQWLLVKSAGSVKNWVVLDNMRGLTAGGDNEGYLVPNTSDQEYSGTLVKVNATGFQASGSSMVAANGVQYIYIAIRRGPMKVPTSGTSVFSPVTYAGTGSAATTTTGFVTDLAIIKSRGTYSPSFEDRLRGANKVLESSSTGAEVTTTQYVLGFDTQSGVRIGDDAGVNASGTNYIDWAFRRAPSFFDEVCYTGTGSARTINHNLAAVPELIIVKKRSAVDNWFVYNAPRGNTKFLRLNLTSAEATFPFWNNTSPTASVFSLSGNNEVNGSAITYVAYLFASCAGVSKCTAFTGTGTLQTINCGFTAGSRFVLIKRTDAAGDWYVWDSSRGLSSSTDPYLLLNSTAAEVTSTNWVDTTSTGFQVTAASGNNVNINGASYIALAIA